jgi:hypothetical protein
MQNNIYEFLPARNETRQRNAAGQQYMFQLIQKLALLPNSHSSSVRPNKQVWPPRRNYELVENLPHTAAISLQRDAVNNR